MAIMTRFGRSGVAYVQPGSKRCSMPLDPQHGSSCTVDQNLAGKTLPRLLNSSNPALPPLFMLSSVMAMVGGKRRGKVFGG